MPFKYNKNLLFLDITKKDFYTKLKKIFDNTNNIFEKESNLIEQNYKVFFEYFSDFWLKFFKDGMLNYAYLSIEQRSNSYIENYNRIIKLKLSKFLYGKNHCIITWPLFHQFIKNEEDEYRNEILEFENAILCKKHITKFKKTKKIELEPKEKSIIVIKDKNNNTSPKHYWFKWNADSCRYDTFSVLYAYVIKPRLDKLNLTPMGDISNYFNNLTLKAINLNYEEYANGIWNFLIHNKDENYDLTYKTMAFKKQATFFNLLDLLRFNKLFCITYALNEGCSFCNDNKNTINFYSPYIMFTEDDILNKLTIQNMIQNKFINEMTTCSKCGYYNDTLIDTNNPTYYRIYNNIILPKIIFIGLDLMNDNDAGIKGALTDQMKLEFNRRKKLINIILEIIKDKFIIYNQIYYLSGIISTPFYNHFTCFIINYYDNKFGFNKGKDYFYDGMVFEHDIKIINNLNKKLLSNYPYLCLYINYD